MMMTPANLLRALDRSHSLPGATCPRCRKPIDQNTSVGEPGAEPRTGDVSVCFSCEALLEYQQVDASAALSFRLMTDAEVAALDDEALLSLLDAIEVARIMRKAL